MISWILAWLTRASGVCNYIWRSLVLHMNTLASYEDVSKRNYLHSPSRALHVGARGISFQNRRMVRHFKLQGIRKWLCRWLVKIHDTNTQATGTLERNIRLWICILFARNLENKWWSKGSLLHLKWNESEEYFSLETELSSICSGAKDNWENQFTCMCGVWQMCECKHFAVIMKRDYDEHLMFWIIFFYYFL